MDGKPVLDRRDLLGWLAAGPVLLATPVRAEMLPAMVVFRDPTCGCCHKWVEHLTANGFAVTEHLSASGFPAESELIKAHRSGPGRRHVCVYQR